MASQVAKGELAKAAIEEPAAMLLDVRCIRPYERNPRQCENPEYDRIKASIRAIGLDQPLVVTQRPGTTDYIVHSGGNTRLLILKELYEENSNDRFAHVRCLIKPWNRESDVLLAHLRENDLRGSLSFIDKARAVFDIKQLLEAELGIEALSQRRLEMALHAGGYALSQGLISRMGYAVKRLLPLIPRALNAGLGRPQVQRIRALDDAAFQLWQRHSLGDEAAFDEVFAALCRRFDDPDWDTGQLQGAFEAEIAEQAEVSINRVRVELDAQLAGEVLTIPEFEDDNGTASETGEAAIPAEKPQMHSLSLQTEPNAVNRGIPCEDPEQNVEHDRATEGNRETIPEATDLAEEASLEAPDSPVEQILTAGQSAPSDLKSLRARAWTLASRLAQRNGIGELVEPLSGKGLGFILRDVPDPALADQLDDETLSQISMVWWHLAACAEMTVAPIASLVPMLPAESVLRRALEQQDAGLLFSGVWTLDPGNTGYRLWRRVGEPDWRDLLNLMDTYRRISHLADETETRLWE
ncbi:ParB family protein [Candidatus Thiodiazotropha sp. LNASS1]|uniref:ParB family protein n=1 Tax=Candidatus Thiodiazotropha sp. LNASS1 TaxID=3096260 RepID=UPI0034DE68E0